MKAFGQPSWGLTRALPETGYEATVARVRDALAAEGFGVLTEIDVKATLAKKLGVELDPYVILGACNPQLAYDALQHEPGIGLLLPCNVVVAAQGEGAVVSIADPRAMFSVVDDSEMQGTVEDARARLARVLAAL